jgi:hypothetical protein
MARRRVRRDATDIAFSTLVRVRANWTCEATGRRFDPSNASGLECAHIFGRRSRATRWHADNAIALSTKAHMHFTANPVVFTEWITARIGQEAVDRLRYLHGLPVKLSKADLLDVRRDLQAQVKAQAPGGAFETPATILLAIDEAERLSGRILAAGMVS